MPARAFLPNSALTSSLQFTHPAALPPKIIARPPRMLQTRSASAAPQIGEHERSPTPSRATSPQATQRDTSWREGSVTRPPSVARQSPALRPSSTPDPVAQDRRAFTAPPAQGWLGQVRRSSPYLTDQHRQPHFPMTMIQTCAKIYILCRRQDKNQKKLHEKYRRHNELFRRRYGRQCVLNYIDADCESFTILIHTPCLTASSHRNKSTSVHKRMPNKVTRRPHSRDGFTPLHDFQT
jgi:hypothetical protein